MKKIAMLGLVFLLLISTVLASTGSYNYATSQENNSQPQGSTQGNNTLIIAAFVVIVLVLAWDYFKEKNTFP